MDRNITNNINEIKKRIASACKKCGRTEDSVRLLLATKTVSPEIIRIAINSGEKLIGENKVQEFTAKSALLSDLEYERHFIGHLQTNKIKEVLKYVSCIETVDRMDLANKLNSRLEIEERVLDIFIQVNTSLEGTKSGIDPDKALSFIDKVKLFPNLKIKGFMTIGLFSDDTIAVRRSYSRLREIREKAIEEKILPSGFYELSMGMSDDLEIAIEEGATIVRVGSSIFGERVYN